MTKLSPEEREILEAFEAGKTKRSKQAGVILRASVKAAEEYTAKNARINIRLHEADLSRLKLRAVEEGMPYQTLIASILHKYVTGRLKDTRQ